MWDEVNTGTNLPAEIKLSRGRRRRLQVPVHGQGRRLGQQELPVPGDQGPAQRRSAAAVFLDDKMRLLGTAACPPYHLAVVIGGTSAEFALETAKLASARYLDTCPPKGSAPATPSATSSWRPRCWKLTQTGIGAQFGGKYFCHDVRVIRLPRHGASCPVGIGVSCSADRQAGQDHRRRRLPRAAGDRPGAASCPRSPTTTWADDVVHIDLNRRWPRSAPSSASTR
jgi:fumarate hydratase class I